MTEQDDARAAAERARNFLAGLDAVPDDADEVLFDARVEALRSVMPGAGPHAELRLRLAGPNIRDGFYDSEMESALADPLRREFATTAGTKSSPLVEVGWSASPLEALCSTTARRSSNCRTTDRRPVSSCPPTPRSVEC